MRGPGGASLVSYDSAFGLGRTSSQASSHQRRADAQRALQSFVIKEQLSPGGSAAAAQAGRRLGEAVGEPGSPTNPLKVPTVRPAAGEREGQTGGIDPLLGVGAANHTATSGSGEMAPKGKSGLGKTSGRLAKGLVSVPRAS